MPGTVVGSGDREGKDRALPLGSFQLLVDPLVTEQQKQVHPGALDIFVHTHTHSLWAAKVCVMV